jgi:hypothetical protein
MCIFVTVNEAQSYFSSTVEVRNTKAPFSGPPERKAVSRRSMYFVLTENLLLFCQGVNKRLPWPSQGEPSSLFISSGWTSWSC